MRIDHRSLFLQRKRAHKGFSPFLFEKIAQSIAERLACIKRSFKNIIDITPFHTGGLGPFVSTLYPQAAYGSFGGFGDIPPASVDCVVSALHLHWVEDLSEFLNNIFHILAPDGLFVASFWGDRTLHELRQCLLEAEISCTQGASPRVLPMISVYDATRLLQRAGFSLPVVDVDHFRVYYPDLVSLGRHLRTMGEANALVERRRFFTSPHLFYRAHKCYTRSFLEDKGLPATFSLITLTGWAPHHSQQRPLSRGSAAHSLAKALSTKGQK